MSYYLFADSTNCSGFRKYIWGIRKFAYFWSNFERYNVLSICLWNPKQQRSKKSNNVADTATNMILACCGICLQGTESTVWPRNDSPVVSNKAHIQLYTKPVERNLTEVSKHRSIGGGGRVEEVIAGKLLQKSLQGNVGKNHSLVIPPQFSRKE